MAHTVKSMIMDMRGRYRPTLVGRVGQVSEDEAKRTDEVVVEEKPNGAETPEEKMVVKNG